MDAKERAVGLMPGLGWVIPEGLERSLAEPGVFEFPGLQKGWTLLFVHQVSRWNNTYEASCVSG